MNQPTPLILGTAGHIDHGKTTLVKALTGTDTDRLPEEKRRGITIELGYAKLDLGEVVLGIVDVPGHERFVRNMLAGATGVDLALLVVAADESVKPQTREHLDILKLLRLHHGVIALTKCDKVDADWLELVQEEVRELVQGTFLADAPIVPTSAPTGQGLPELREALLQAARQAAARRAAEPLGPFRMAVDRVFVKEGHGTVVTGSVVSGRAEVGQELAVQPGEISVRVRGIQSHEQAVQAVQRGQRAAINLHGIHHTQLRRGHELCEPGYLVPSRLMTVRCHLLPGAPRPLKHRSRVRLHLGTAEILAVVSFHQQNELPPGEETLAQLFLSQPAVAAWGQPFVLRSESPVATIGGGHVLDPVAPKLRRKDETAWDWARKLDSPEAIQRVQAALYFFGTRPWQAADLVRATGVTDPEKYLAQLEQQGELLHLAWSPTRTATLSRAAAQAAFAQIARVLEKLHAQQPLKLGIPQHEVLQRLSYLGPPALVQALVEEMVRQGEVLRNEQGLQLRGHGPKLSAGERRLLDQLVQIYAQAGERPPSVDEVTRQVGKRPELVDKLLKLAAAQGTLVALSPTLYMHRDAERRLRRQVAQLLADGQGRTLSQIREALGTTRKYAVPLCEYFDSLGLTQRQGDLRVLGPRAGELAEQAQGG